ncbi:MAG: hypothetical protein B7X92_10340 [Novosphingobium sp. 17-62-9]|nr:MAG: hypothetical protein B7Z36_02335 [Novosphingobium sp. 12-63-9]OZA34373.1 MAG: hypothetical protein B7X92_10340 [Novosphingobium sp. 17-62-9]
MDWNTIAAIIAFILGWKARGYADTILTRLMMRIFSSAFGKRVVLEKLEEGIRKLDANPQPQDTQP